MKQTRRAFTLLEMTVVLAVACLAMAFAIPKVSRLRDAAAVRGAAADLASMFGTARQTAIARRSAVAVLLDTGAGNVSLRSAGQTLVRHDLRGVYGVRISSDGDSAVYDARGVGYGVSNLSVNVSRGSFIDTLTVSRIGRVRW